MSVKLASRPVGTRLIIMAAVLALAGLLATAGQAGSARAATVGTEHAAAVTGTGSAKPTNRQPHPASPQVKPRMDAAVPGAPPRERQVLLRM